MEHMRHLPEYFACWLFVPLRLQICVDFSFVDANSFAFCKRFIAMGMYMWLITLQKNVSRVALVLVYGSIFMLFVRFLLEYGSF